MSFQLRPHIYSLLLCSSVEQDEESGGWLLHPFSHITTERVPVDLAMSVVAHIMAPPGRYELALNIFHSGAPEQVQSMPPRAFTVQEGKNLEFILHIEATILQTGLHIVEASITGHHTMDAPLRVSRT